MHKILLAEDDANLAALITKKLAVAGFSIELANDGRQALEKLGQEPDLLLLDIGMPELNGFQVLEAKQKNPALKDICTIVISNSGDPAEITRLKNLGVRDYLIKVDFDPDELVEKVKNCFKKNLQGKRLMVVEDETFIRQLLAKKLRESGYDVLETATGEECLEKVKNEKLDLILLDILLPGIDGFEILKKLKEQHDSPPVIIISNLGEQSDIQKGLALGAKDYIVKAHFNPEDIIAKVEDILR